MKEIKYKQRDRYGCGYYCLANLFDEPRYLDFIETDVGAGTYHLNKAMNILNPENYLAVLFSTSQKLDFQNRLFDASIFEIHNEEGLFNNCFWPFFVTVVVPSPHYILACLDLETNLFHVANPLRENIVIMDIPTMLLKYHVVGLDILDWSNKQHLFGEQHETVICVKSFFPHLF